MYVYGQLSAIKDLLLLLDQRGHSTNLSHRHTPASYPCLDEVNSGTWEVDGRGRERGANSGCRGLNEQVILLMLHIC